MVQTKVRLLGYNSAGRSSRNHRFHLLHDVSHFRPINVQRNERGAFANILKYIKEYDHETFYKFTRMERRHFEKLLSLVKHKLLKRSRREYLSPEFRLAMTLKYLAHGGSFLNLSWEFRIGHSTVLKVIVETCDVLWEVL